MVACYGQACDKRVWFLMGAFSEPRLQHRDRLHGLYVGSSEDGVWGFKDQTIV
jgi:hypothetical protein